MTALQEIARRIRDTRDLADADHASGHLSDFWHARIHALCGMLYGVATVLPTMRSNPNDHARQDPH